MIKQALNQIDYALCAELALLIFVAVFIAVAIRTFLTKGDTTQRWANIVLSDLPHGSTETSNEHSDKNQAENNQE